EVAIHMILFVRGIYPPEIFESTQKYNCPIKTARHPGLISYIQQIVRSIRSELQKDSIHKICFVTLDPAGKALDRFVFEMSMLKPFEDSILRDLYQNRSVNDQIDKGKNKATEESNKDYEVYEGGFVGDDNEGGHVNDDDEPLHRTTARERLDKHYNNQQQFRPQHDQYEGPRFGGMIALTTDVEMLFRAMLLKIKFYVKRFMPVLVDSSFTVVVEMKTPGKGPDTKPEFPWSPINATTVLERSKLSSSVDLPSPARKIIPVKTINVADIQSKWTYEH
ncbi:MAD2 mitotic arrest deficient-like 2, partial [Entomortierella lignicola]